MPQQLLRVSQDLLALILQSLKFYQWGIIQVDLIAIVLGTIRLVEQIKLLLQILHKMD